MDKSVTEKGTLPSYAGSQSKAAEYPNGNKNAEAERHRVMCIFGVRLVGLDGDNGADDAKERELLNSEEAVGVQNPQPRSESASLPCAAL